MQRSLCLVSLIVSIPFAMSVNPAFAGPGFSARGFSAPLVSTGSKISGGKISGSRAPLSHNIPFASSRHERGGFGSDAADFRRPKLLLPPIHERKRVLPLILGAGSPPLFASVDYPDTSRYQPLPERAFSPEFAQDEGIVRPFIEAPRPYAPPSFIIIGKPSRKNMSGSVQLVRGGAANTSASDPRVVFLNDDGSESRPVGKSGRRK